MKQKVLLGLFVSLPFVCTIPVFATGNIPATEKRDIKSVAMMRKETGWNRSSVMFHRT